MKLAKLNQRQVSVQGYIYQEYECFNCRMFSGVLSLLTAEMLANSGHTLSDDPENAVHVGFMTVRTMLAFILSNKLVVHKNVVRHNKHGLYFEK